MDSRIMLKAAVLGPIGTNVYFVKNTETGEMFIVDPADDAARIKQAVSSMEGNPAAILLTHGHFDHIMAVKDIRDEYDIPVYACRQEEQVLKSPAANLSAGYGMSISIEADRYLEDNEEFECAGFNIRMMHTPGHTKGSCCYYLEEGKLLFSGDTLFHGSAGRTDFPGGSMTEIVRSLHMLTETLPEDTVVLPGHESATTIGDEKRYNPFVQNSDSFY